MRRMRRMVAGSVLGAALMLGAVAITPMPAQSADGPDDDAVHRSGHRTGVHQAVQKMRKARRLRSGRTDRGNRAQGRQDKKTQAATRSRARGDESRAKQAESQEQQQQWNAEMAKQVSEIQPFAREFGDRWYKKISIGTLVYADYRYFTHTGFGPQNLTQQFWPGPGNNSFNSFDITRAYLDFKFTPDDNFMMRVTPNVYEG